jgi:hypothetical protein
MAIETADQSRRVALMHETIRQLIQSSLQCPSLFDHRFARALRSGETRGQLLRLVCVGAGTDGRVQRTLRRSDFGLGCALAQRQFLEIGSRGLEAAEINVDAGHVRI